MSYRIPNLSLSYAIREERAHWLQNCTPAERAAANAALDRLARQLAEQLHPTKQAEFLARAGVTQKD